MIAERPADQHQRREEELVRLHDPLHGSKVGMEIALEDRKRNVDRGGVNEDERGSEDGRGEDGAGVLRRHLDSMRSQVESRKPRFVHQGRRQRAEVCCERLRYSSSLCGRPSLRILSSDLVVSPSHWQSGRKGTRTRPKITSAFCPLPSAFCLLTVLSRRRRSAPSLPWMAFRCSRRRRACRTRAGCSLSWHRASRTRPRSCRPRYGTSGRRTAGRSPNREWPRGA